MESRRRERIRWFKHISLTLLNSVKERYKMLSAAVDRYAADESEENLKIESMASTSILITACSGFNNKKRDTECCRIHSKSMDNSETRRCTFPDWRRVQDG